MIRTGLTPGGFDFSLDALLQFLGLGYLLLQLFHLRVMTRVARGEIRQLGPQAFQFVIQGRERPEVSASASGMLQFCLQRAVLREKRFVVDLLLFDAIAGIDLRLQAGLQPGKDLNVTLQLSRELAQITSLELANALLLPR